jgi:hypothetical protein
VTKYSLPKILLSWTIESLDIVFLRRQYQDLMFLSENMGRMKRAEPYRKYRPDVNGYRKHYREWYVAVFFFPLQVLLPLTIDTHLMKNSFVSWKLKNWENRRFCRFFLTDHLE